MNTNEDSTYQSILTDDDLLAMCPAGMYRHSWVAGWKAGDEAAVKRRPKKGSFEAVFGHLGVTPDEVGNELIALREEVEVLRASVSTDAAKVARILQRNIGASRDFSGLDDDEKDLWDLCQRVIDAGAKHG